MGKLINIRIKALAGAMACAVALSGCGNGKEMTFKYNSYKLAVGESISIYNNEKADDTWTYISMNNDIAVVDEKGTITGIDEGTTEIIVRNGKREGIIDVKVSKSHSNSLKDGGDGRLIAKRI